LFARSAGKVPAPAAINEPSDIRFEVQMIDRSKLPNTFEFVVTAGARARQLLAGSVPRVEAGEHKKTTVAAKEVLVGVVEALPYVKPAADVPIDQE
jgi:DNA-directed RNA polymerase omega subunit